MNEQVMEGFGESTAADLAELRKALSVGYTDPVSGNDSIRVESLESTLKVLSFQAQHVKIWNAINKQDAYSTIEEYNLLTQYGGLGGGFVEAGALPEEEDSTYSRQAQKVKYVGTTRAVHHPTTLIRAVPADVIAQETANGVLWMLGKIERGLIAGNSAHVPQEWDGLETQIIAGGGTVVDMRGAPLTSTKIEEATDIIAQNFGVASMLYANNTVFSDFSKTYYGQQRWTAPNAPAGKVGTPVTGMSTQAGDIEFESNIFMKKGGDVPAAATNAKAPSAPTLALGAPGAVGGSLFIAGDAGTYKWQVTAINAFGESAPCALSAGGVLAAGQGIVLTITDGGGAYPATGYRIYRTGLGGSTTSFSVQIARNAITGVYQATTAWTEKNEYLPGTFGGLLLDMSAQSLTFKQLSPLIKMPLAQIGPSIRWMQLLYGTPIVYAPKKNVVYRNIGRA